MGVNTQFWQHSHTKMFAWCYIFGQFYWKKIKFFSNFKTIRSNIFRYNCPTSDHTSHLIHPSSLNYRPAWDHTSTVVVPARPQPPPQRPRPLFHQAERVGAPPTCPEVGALRARRYPARRTTICIRWWRTLAAVRARATTSTWTFTRTQITPLCLWVFTHRGILC